MPGVRRSQREDQRSPRDDERGQVIVLFALALVVLLGVLALILDGGRVYTERRRSQNAADAAATAGAAALDMSNPPGSIVSSLTAVQQAACAAAGANGFGSGSVDATCGPNGSVVRIHVPFSNDGLAGPLSGVLPQFEAQGYVQVTVTSSFRPVVAGVMGFSNFAATSLAVAVNIPGHGVGYTLLVLDPIDCGAFSINGGTSLDVYGGGVQVNSSASRTAAATCTSNNAAVTTGGTDYLTTHGGYANTIVGTGDTSGVTPAWTPGDFIVDPLAGVHVPPFPDANHPSIPGQPGTPTAPKMWLSSQTPFPALLTPGVIWGGIDVKNGDTLVLAGGTYIMAGGGFNVDGGVVEAQGPVTFIYTQDPSCNSNSSGSCTVPSQAGNLTGSKVPTTIGQNTGATGGSWGLQSAPLTAPTANTVDPYLNGILIYVDRDVLPCTGTGNATLVIGGSGSFYFDTGSIIYAPCSTVKLYGNNGSYGGAVVSYQISINGGKTLDLGGPGVPNSQPSKSNLVQ